MISFLVLVDDLPVLRKMFVNVLDPARLLLHYILCGARVFHLPFIDELASVADFSRHTRNTELAKRPVILITTDRKAHDLLAGAFECTIREWRILADLGEDRENSRPALLNVVGLPSVKRIDE